MAEALEYLLTSEATHHVITLQSGDGTNKLTSAKVLALTMLFSSLDPRPVILTGNDRFFSAGADLNEIRRLDGSTALAFARAGQRLMDMVATFPAPVIACVHGYCMGGGFDLALACDRRICAPNALFAHRGAALGIMTGWGGTQRLPRLIGRARALPIFLCGEKLDAESAQRLGAVSLVAEDPMGASVALVTQPAAYPCTPSCIATSKNGSLPARPCDANPIDRET